MPLRVPLISSLLSTYTTPQAQLALVLIFTHVEAVSWHPLAVVAVTVYCVLVAGATVWVYAVELVLLPATELDQA